MQGGAPARFTGLRAHAEKKASNKNQGSAQPPAAGSFSGVRGTPQSPSQEHQPGARRQKGRRPGSLTGHAGLINAGQPRAGLRLHRNPLREGRAPVRRAEFPFR